MKLFPRKYTILVLFWGFVYILFLLLDTHIDQFGELNIYSSIADKIMLGRLPFIDFFSEYPPGSVLVFIIPQLFSAISYKYIFSFLNLLMIMGTIYLGSLLVKKHHSKVELPSLVFQSIAFLIMIGLVFARYDITPVFLTMLGVYLFVSGEESKSEKIKTLSYVVITLSGWIKLYSFVILPFFIIYEIKNKKKWQEILQIVSVCVLVSLPFLWILYQGQEGLRWFFEYHGGRGLEIESTYSSAILFLSQIGLLDGVSIIYNYASYGLTGVVPAFFAHYSFYIFGLTYVALIVSAFRDDFRNKTSFHISKYTFLSILVFIVTNKVFSTQYMLWLLPFMIILPFWFEKKRQQILLGLAFVILISTALIFPFGWEIFNKGNLLLSMVLLMRNVLLLVYGYLLLSKKILK